MKHKMSIRRNDNENYEVNLAAATGGSVAPYSTYASPPVNFGVSGVTTMFNGRQLHMDPVVAHDNLMTRENNRPNNVTTGNLASPELAKAEKEMLKLRIQMADCFPPNLISDPSRKLHMLVLEPRAPKVKLENVEPTIGTVPHNNETNGIDDEDDEKESNSVRKWSCDSGKFQVIYKFYNKSWMDKPITDFSRLKVRFPNFIHHEGQTRHTTGAVEHLMECADGGSLLRYIELLKSIKRDISEENTEGFNNYLIQFCNSIVLQLVEGIFYLEHVIGKESAFPHRNITPKTILLRTDGCLKLRTPNLLNDVHIKENQDNYFNGYASPEAIKPTPPTQGYSNRSSMDFKSDMWSIGAIAYSIMTCQSLLPPYLEKDIDLMHGEKPKLNAPEFYSRRNAINDEAQEMDAFVLGNTVKCDQKDLLPPSATMPYSKLNVDKNTLDKYRRLPTAGFVTKQKFINGKSHPLTKSDVDKLSGRGALSKEVTNKLREIEKQYALFKQDNETFDAFTKLSHDDKRWEVVFPNDALRKLVQKLLERDSSARINSLDAMASIYTHGYFNDNNAHSLDNETTKNESGFRIVKHRMATINSNNVSKSLENRHHVREHTGINLLETTDSSCYEDGVDSKLNEQIGKYNTHPISKKSNSLNLHSLLSTSENILCVPYPTNEVSQQLLEPNQNDSYATTDVRSLFIGQMPLFVNQTIVRLMIKIICNVDVLKCTVTPPSINKEGKITSPLVVIDVPDKDVLKVIANIHRRVIMDQTGFYVAMNEEQCMTMYRYVKMLFRQPEIQSQNRPRTSVTCTLANPAGMPRRSAPIYNNVWNNLCKCGSCQGFHKHSTDYDHLLNWYFPEIVHKRINIDQFDLKGIVETHAYIKDKDRLNDIQRQIYSDVVEQTRENSIKSIQGYWPQYRNREDRDDFWETCCRTEMPPYGPVSQGGKGEMIPPEILRKESSQLKAHSIAAATCGRSLDDIQLSTPVVTKQDEKEDDSLVIIEENIGWRFNADLDVIDDSWVCVRQNIPNTEKKHVYDELWEIYKDARLSKYTFDELFTKIKSFFLRTSEFLCATRQELRLESGKNERKVFEKNLAEYANIRESNAWKNCARGMCIFRNGYLGYMGSNKSYPSSDLVNDFADIINQATANIVDEIFPNAMEELDKIVSEMCLDLWMMKMLEKHGLLNGFSNYSKVSSVLSSNNVTADNFCNKISNEFFGMLEDSGQPVGDIIARERLLALAQAVKKGVVHDEHGMEPKLISERVSALRSSFWRPAEESKPNSKSPFQRLM